MENFWIGFEKQAFLGAVARGIGQASHHLRTGGASALEAAKQLPGKVKFLPKQLHQEYLQGQVNAANAARRAAGGTKQVARKGKAVVQKGTQVAQDAAKPQPMAGIRGRGKALLTGGLLGAGGVYAAGGDGNPQQPMPY